MVKKYLEETLTERQKESIYWNSDVTTGMIQALEYALIHNDNGIGLPYWSKKNPVIVRDLTFVLSKLGIATVKVSKKFSRLEFNTALINDKEFKQWRLNSKLAASVMRLDTNQYSADLVKVNGKARTTGLNRKGFARVAKCEFGIDTQKLQEYYRPIKQNLIKSIKVGIEQGKIKDKFFEDKANYRLVVNYAMQYYVSDANRQYNLESNTSDQRGRSIFKALKRIGNPISSKDFRALLVVPKEYAIAIKAGDKEAVEDIFYFIGELTGSKATTAKKKILAGYKAYNTRHLPILNLQSEDDRKELHERIWLERIYAKLDTFYAEDTVLWDVPLEIDASMSMAQLVGSLTNDERLLESTNVIGDTLSDPWYIEGVRRLSAKAVGTPVFYGSSQSAIALLKSKKIDIDKAEVARIRKEFASGRFAVMKQFKDLLIQNYSIHTPVIKIKLYKDEFNIYVNKFKQAGAEIVVTEAFDTKTNRFKLSYTHEPVMVPDYARMKLFFATLCIHGLDSQIMNYLAELFNKMWMLTIHDAIIGLPGQLNILRKAYADELKKINDQRHKILADYRKSIGATSFKSDVDYYKLSKSVVESKATSFLATAMK